VTRGLAAAAAGAAVLAGLSLAVPARAQASVRYAVGLSPSADADVLRGRLEASGLRVESLAPIPALVVETHGPPPPRLAGVRYVERLGERRLAFSLNDPLVPRQWYLAFNRAYDAWEVPPPLAPVQVAVIDSGVDGNHPELAPRISDAKSFVGGSPRTDSQGHGTFVAGLIAAVGNNQTGIAGMTPAAELLVAKVVTPERTIPVEAEARAIRWAVARGARVINMSLGGLRDPLDPSRDTYSPLEADAIAHAVENDVVVVAAVGNSDQAPQQPWRYASYPAALPHVLGVSAVARDGSVPAFSNRDALFNDIAAPGQEIVSTFPRALTASTRPSCLEQGYSLCASEEYRSAEGTSFAAPQVSAAAASLIATRPELSADQVTALLTRSAVDAAAATGCKQCLPGRDELSGWGRLDVTAAIQNALAGPAFPGDIFEPNDDAGKRAYTLWGPRRRVTATLDYWDDQNDVYRVYLRRGQTLYASLVGPRRTDTTLALWGPETFEIDDLAQQDLRVRLSSRPGPNEHLAYRAPAAGFHYVHVKLSAEGGPGAYRLSLVKKRR
jgi:subtilisin family serine protease